MSTLPKLAGICLETDRLILRDFANDDAEGIQAYAGDPAVTLYTSFGPSTQQETTSVLAGWIREKERVPRLEWPLAIVQKYDGLLIGGSGLGAVDWSTGQAAFGYVLRRSAWGKGFATEAGRAVCNWAFHELVLHELVAHCEAVNTPSVAVLQKLGFCQEAPVTLPRVSGEIRRYLTFVAKSQ